jgi:DNA-binding CsgD family transcriptional regulator
MTIEEKIEQFKPVAENLPGVVVIHRIEGFAPLYMSSMGLDLIGLTLEELKEVGEDYNKRFLNEDFMDDYLVFLRKMMKEKSEDHAYNFFHQVQLKEGEDYVWYNSAIKVFYKDEQGFPTHSVTIAFPLGDLEHIPQKAEKMLDESLFLKRNRQKFHSLSSRGIEVLRLVALGKTSAEIAEDLHLSAETVNSHRKIVKRKLGISSTYQFTRYARSFDLI